MKLALEAMRSYQGDRLESGGEINLEEEIKALEEALAKQEHGEPVGEAYLCDCCLTPFDGAYECPSCGHNSSTKEPIYTRPQPKRKPLTSEEYSIMAEQYTGADGLDCVDFGRAISRHYGIKE
jgi:hypothetical protein